MSDSQSTPNLGGIEAITLFRLRVVRTRLPRRYNVLGNSGRSRLCKTRDVARVGLVTDIKVLVLAPRAVSTLTREFLSRLTIATSEK